MKKVRSLCMLSVVLALSCDKATLTDEEMEKCRDVFCTAEVRTIEVNVVDESGDPVALDRIKVTRTADGKDLTETYTDDKWAAFQQLGSYPLINDGHQRDVPKFRDTDIRFQGYIGNREVVSADYVATFDCCHIALVSGEQELVVNR